MDPYEQYLADAAYEDYLAQAAAEEQAQQSLGPDFSGDLRMGEFYKQGLKDLPNNIVNTVKEGAKFAGEVYDRPIERIQEVQGDTWGNLVSGIAGAGAGGLVGAEAGAGIGGLLAPFTLGASVPIGASLGGILGGGIGFGAGLMGYQGLSDMLNPEKAKPLNETLNKFAYDSATGAGFELGARAIQLPYKGVKKAYTTARDTFTNTGADARVVAELQARGVTPEKIDTALSEAGPLAEYRSLGELLNDPILKNKQRVLARSGNETILPDGTKTNSYGKATDIYNARNAEQLRLLDQVEQSPVGMPEVVASVQEGIGNKLASSQRGLTAAEEALAQSVAELPLPITPEAVGSLTREGYQAGKTAIKKAGSEAFDAIGTGITDPTPALAKANEILPNYFKEVGANPNPELVKLISDLKREPIPNESGLLDPNTMKGSNWKSAQPITTESVYTMQDIQALRSQALKIAEKADPKSAAVAGQIAEALKTVGDNAVKAGTVTAEEAANWATGIKLWKEKGRIYESSATPAKAILARDPYTSEFKVPTTEVPSRIFRPGKDGRGGVVEGIRNYKEIMGAEDAALEPLYRYATNSFREFALKNDGKGNSYINTKNANKWIRDHADALSELPDLKRQLTDIHTRGQFLNEKLGELKRTQAEIDKGAASYLLKGDVDTIIPTILSGKNPVKQIVATVEFLKRNDKDAVAGFRKGFVDYLKKKSFQPSEMGGIEEALASGKDFQGKVHGGTFTRELQKVIPILQKSKLMSDAQIKQLNYLYGDKMSQLSVENAKMPAGSDTIQNNTVLKAMKSIASDTFLPRMPGWVRGSIRILAPALQKIPEGRFLTRMEDAILNPSLARDLMVKANPRTVTRAAQKIFAPELQAMIGPLGATSAVVSPAPQKPKKPYIPNQQAVTSKKSFPDPKELLSPPAKGSLGGISVKEYLEGLDQETQSRISVESSGDPFAVSPKGAQGLSQLMPKTAQQVARELGEIYTPLREGMTPEEQKASIDQNIRFGKYYYNQQLKKYGNSTLAWAAYNAGPGATDDAIKMAGTSRDVGKVLSYLPEETRNYIKKLQGLTGIG